MKSKAVIDPPPVTTSLICHLSAEIPRGMDFSGPNVTRWIDLSGNGNHFDLTSGDGPTFSPNEQNSLGALTFTNDRLEAAAFFSGSSDPGYAFVVLEVDGATPGSASGLWEFGSGTTTNYPFTDDALYQSFGVATRYSVAQNPAGIVRTWHLLEAFSDTVSRGMKINGVNHNVAAQATTGWTTNPFVIGDGTGPDYIGKIAEVAIYNRANMEADADAVTLRAHFNAKWGLGF